jgi:hypothetical protein
MKSKERGQHEEKIVSDGTLRTRKLEEGAGENRAEQGKVC